MKLEDLTAIAGASHVWQQEPMAKHTSFRIGGPADYYVTPSSVREICEIIGLCKTEQIPCTVIGNGSNLLVSDAGYRGVIIALGNEFAACTLEKETGALTAQSGIMLGKLANQAMEAGLSGMEFASGIPGTLGGAVVMNAGAYGGEMKDILISATVLDDRNEVVVLDNQALELGYRTSVVAKKHYIVLEASLQLKSGNREEILALMQDLNGRRREKQPLNYPSAGSTFKRPEGHFAGKLIEECGLRGYQVGDAMVSTKHCGFVVNAGSATAADVMQLITDVKETVYKQTGVMLEPEVKFLG